MNTKQFVRVAMLTALACVLTIVPKVPIGGGYVHFGDCIIYPIFCIPTFIIKGIMGFAIGKIVYGHVDIKHFIIGGIAALVIVTGGYFAAEIPLMGYETALVSLISSPIQWCMSMVASAIIVPILIKNRKRIGF